MKKLFTLTLLFILVIPAARAQTGISSPDNTGSVLVSQANNGVNANNQNAQPSGVATGIQNVAQAGGPATVFPNPAVGEFNINVGGSSTLILFNDIMQQAMEMQLNPGHNHIQSNLATGIYYYIIHSPGQQTLGGHLVIQ